MAVQDSRRCSARSLEIIELHSECRAPPASSCPTSPHHTTHAETTANPSSPPPTAGVLTSTFFAKTPNAAVAPSHPTARTPPLRPSQLPAVRPAPQTRAHPEPRERETSFHSLTFDFGRLNTNRTRFRPTMRKRSGVSVRKNPTRRGTPTPCLKECSLKSESEGRNSIIIFITAPSGSNTRMDTMQNGPPRISLISLISRVAARHDRTNP